MNNIDPQFQNLLSDILNNGVKKQTRNGETLSVFGRTIRHNMSDGFPLLTTKKMYWKGIVTELLWFLKGDTNIKYLVDNDCHIWDGDAYKRYERAWNWDLDEPLPKDKFIERIKTDEQFAKTWGELGPIYGKQWRKWHTRWDVIEDKSREAGVRNIEYGIDQIQNLINELKTNPDSRRMMVNTWNVGELDQMTLPPCHYGFQVYTRKLTWEERYEYMYNTNVRAEDGFRPPLTPEMLQQYNIPTRAISLMWNQRSVDTFLGLPFNIASYGLLLLMIADEVGMVPEELIGNLGDTHLYVEHIDAAKEQINRTPYPLPTVKVQDGIFCSSVNDVVLENYQSHPTINAKLLN